LPQTAENPGVALLNRQQNVGLSTFLFFFLYTLPLLSHQKKKKKKKTWRDDTIKGPLYAAGSPRERGREGGEEKKKLTRPEMSYPGGGIAKESVGRG
jgi:hypothetical protein